MANQKLAIIKDKNTLKELLSNDTFKEALSNIATKYMTADKVVKIALLAASRQPKLFNCTKQSFIQSAIKAAELGLDFAGQTGQGYLIPYGSECQFIPGYQGLLELAYRSGQVSYIDAQIVYAKDKFDYDLGDKPFISFKPNLLEDDRGKPVCAFAIVRLKGSEYPKVELMTYKQLMAVKGRSKAANNGPWKTDEPEMMRKTVVRRAFKYIPKTPEIDTALEADNQMYDLNAQAIAENMNAGVDGLKDRLNQQNGKKHIDSKEVPTTENLGDEQDAETKAKVEEQRKKLQETDKQEPQFVYVCKSCKAEFDEPKQGKGGVALCPRCSSSKFEAVEKELAGTSSNLKT